MAETFIIVVSLAGGALFYFVKNSIITLVLAIVIIGYLHDKYPVGERTNKIVTRLAIVALVCFFCGGILAHYVTTLL